MLISNEENKRGSWEHFLLRAAKEISLSEAQYEQISERYSQLQKILNASDDPLLANAHIFVQGSIRLKTTIKPVSGAPEELNTIDADAVVWLPNAQGASAHEVLNAIENRFRAGSRVHSDIQQLRRGIRIVYADENPGFHIDVTPARAILGNSQSNGEGKLEVPDRVACGWKASSPIAYSKWLQQASMQTISLEESVMKSNVIDAATQDPIPDYDDYAYQDPLRATIKLLKRHRDEWALRRNRIDHRPISAVITTLATQAYIDVSKESHSTPLKPLDAILAIIERMPNYIKEVGNQYLVINPVDSGENFAEKWNRPQEGHLYRSAFLDWHANSSKALLLGLLSFESAKDFAEAIHENFGIGSSFISSVNDEIPAHWTMPGRPEGITPNTESMKSLFGGQSGTTSSQKDVKPVERLG